MMEEMGWAKGSKQILIDRELPHVSWLRCCANQDETGETGGAAG